MPRRKAGWIPALTHQRRQQRGRVRIPGRPDVYCGPVGCWPVGVAEPPFVVLQEYVHAIEDYQDYRHLRPTNSTSFTRVCRAWPKLPDHVRQTIVEVVVAVARKRVQ